MSMYRSPAQVRARKQADKARFIAEFPLLAPFLYAERRDTSHTQ